ncbi:hypothetical protein ACB094_07G110500 [Castanea mollissima]
MPTINFILSSCFLFLNLFLIRRDNKMFSNRNTSKQAEDFRRQRVYLLFLADFNNKC